MRYDPRTIDTVTDGSGLLARPVGPIIDGLRLIGRTVFSGKGLAVICPNGVGRTRHAIPSW